MHKKKIHDHNSSKSGIFTLVELLIVIAIIAILASMLLPALRRAKDKAQEIICGNNQKQLNHATIMYCDNQDGYFPRDSRHASGTWNGTWFFSLAGKDLPDSEIYLNHKGYGIKDGNPYFCPTNPAPCDSGSKGWTNYAINSNVIGERIARVKSNKVLYLDSVNIDHTSTWYKNAGARYSNPWKDTYPVHHKNIILVRIDGSADSIYVMPHPVATITGQDLGDLKHEWFYPVN